MGMDHLDHENLDVYRCSLEFLALVFHLLVRLPRGEREIRDQLKRAAMSIPLNIAEGAGKRTGRASIRSRAAPRWNAARCWTCVASRGWFPPKTPIGGRLCC